MMLPTTSDGGGHHRQQSYGHVNPVSKTVWSVKKSLRHFRTRLARENKLRLTLYAVFLLANVIWLGSTLTGLGDQEDSYQQPAGRRRDSSPRASHFGSGSDSTVWGTSSKQQKGAGRRAPRKKRGEDVGAVEGDLGSMAAAAESDADPLGGDLVVRDGVISNRAGERVSIAAKVVHLKTRKDADSDLVIEGGSLRLGSIGKALRRIQCTRERRGTIVYVSGEGPEPDQMAACLRARTGMFEWKSLAALGGAPEGIVQAQAGSPEGGQASDLAAMATAQPLSTSPVASVARDFAVGGTYPVKEGQAVSFVGGKVFPGSALHLSAPVQFGGGEDLLSSRGIKGARKRVGLHALSNKRFLLSYCNSVGSVYLQQGKFSGQQGVAESSAAVLNKAKIVFSKGGKVDVIDFIMLGDEDRFVVSFTEYQSGGRLMAIAGEVLRDDVVSFGVPIEVAPSGAKEIALAPLGSNHVALMYTRMRHHEDAKRGACLVVLEHNPKFKHLDLGTGKGECAADVGTSLDGLKLVNPSNSPSQSIAKDTKLVVGYRDLVSRNTVIQHVVLHESGEAKAKPTVAQNSNSSQEAAPPGKYSATIGPAVIVHDYAVRLTDLRLTPLASSHVIVTYSDHRGAGLILVDTSASEPSVAVGPVIISNIEVFSLSVRAQDHRTVLVGYSIKEGETWISMLIKVNVDLNSGNGEMRMQKSPLITQVLTHSEILPLDEDNFLFGYLLGAKEGEEALGVGGVLVGSFGHVIGIAASEATPGSMAPVVLSGVSAHHRGLYPGQCYYASSTGMPSLQKSAVPLGLSVSDTELLLFAPGCAA